MAHGELKRRFKELIDVNEKQETKVCYHKNKVQNIVFGYLIWVRLFFYGISQALSFKCNNWWVILALSLLWNFIYLLLFLDAMTMLHRAQYQLDIICKELIEFCQQNLIPKNRDDMDLVEAGESCDGFEFGFHKKMLMLDHSTIVGRNVYIYFIVCALLAVAAIELYAYKYLLCK